jgi:hypothetical protein
MKSKSDQIYLAQEGLVNFDSASQSIIDSHFEHPSQVEKGEKQNRLGKDAANQNSQNLTERGIIQKLDETEICRQSSQMSFRISACRIAKAT